MKKNLFIHLSVLAVLIVFVSACSSKKAEYTNVIPSDASQVVTLNLKSIADKAGMKDKENKEALQKLTDAMKSGMNAATFQQVEAVLKDPSSSGVDVEAPMYIFSAPAFPYVTLVAKVVNEDNLLKLLEVMEKEQLSTHVAEADGYSFTKLTGQALLAFTPTTLMIVNYKGNTQLEKAKAGITTLLKQSAENSITSQAGFKKMQKMGGDISMIVSPTSMLGTYANQMNYGISKDIDLKDLTVVGSLSFEKGKIEMKVENYTENAELKALLEKQMKATRPIENTFLKYFPQSTLALFSIGVNGEEFYNALQENEQFRDNFSIAKAAEVKDLFSTFQNDLTFGLINVTMNNNPSFLAYASVQNSDPLKVIYEKKGELGLKRGEDIVKLNENEYVYKSRSINIFFGIRDKQMYATNDELLFKSVGKAADPSVKDANYASGMKGKRMAFVINAEAVLGLPVVKMLVEFGGHQAATYYSLLDNISYLEVTGDSDKSVITLQLKDKNVNALKQIVDFAKGFAGM
ncbi:MAG: DUF4836 family protein [Bacteroides sp.]|nr:DUF4836 family protein [Bacteroides sp.]